MNASEEHEPARYVVELSETAEADIDAAMMRLIAYSPESAERWRLGLLTALETLQQYPNRCPVAEESARYSEIVRVYVYKRSTTAYRVLYTVREAADGYQAVVRVIRILHGARVR